MEKVHRFEAAGLGKAPFRFVGYEKRTFQACVGAPVQVGGSCDFCGTGIMHTFYCESADNKRFKVGSECIAKVGDTGLRNAIEPELKAIRVEIQKAQKAAEADRIAVIAHKINTDPALIFHLNSMKHPQGFSSRETGKPLTMLDWAEWMMKNAGHSGKLKVTRILEKMGVIS